jgi:16S rRNA (cytosine1402-N4)-methyltransferase
MNDSVQHTSVLYEEVLEAFKPVRLKRFVDGTLGAGGHSLGILRKHPELEQLFGIDQDDTALNIAKKRLTDFNERVTFVKGNFSNIKELVKEPVEGILVDLGVSSMQFDEGERGFSFRFDAPLDMRMDRSQELTAKEVIMTYTEKELGKIFRDFGEERYWRRAAKEICKKRKEHPIETTFALKECLDPIWPAYRKRQGIDPITKIFQALRIEVNGELDCVTNFLPQAIDLLNPGGRLAVISFHSLEDRLVKRAFQEASSDKVSTSGRGGVFLDKEPIVRAVSRGAIAPSEKEIAVNRRSRSAKLRIIEKL